MVGLYRRLVRAGDGYGIKDYVDMLYLFALIPTNGNRRRFYRWTVPIHHTAREEYDLSAHAIYMTADLKVIYSSSTINNKRGACID